MNLKRLFYKGVMDLDSDERLLDQGVYREASNVLVTDSESDDSGAVQKSLSTKQLTNLPLGANPKTIFAYADEFRDKIYVGVKSDSGCYLYEWDNQTESASFVLQDTRVVGSRVFDLREDKLVTGIFKITSEDITKELLLFTDDNMEPLCINIERAKTYAVNGFVKEDIYLIKKPPTLAPITQLINSGNVENNLEERFIDFAYRYKYIDGEYSPLSSITRYRFAPGSFKLDYETFENLGMINAFNAVRIGFDTGPYRVTDIQLIMKNSNSNVPYLIETFNKEFLAWPDNSTRYYTFSNNKVYTSLPLKELFWTTNNVPRKAKSLTGIGNKAVFGNYLEGFNMIDATGNKVRPDYTLSLNSTELTGLAIPKTISNGTSTNNVITFDFSGIELKQGTRISFNLKLSDDNDGHEGEYENVIDFILNSDYANASELAADPDFVIFVNEALTNNFLANYDITPPDDSTLDSVLNYSITASTTNTISIQSVTLVFKIDNTPGDTGDNDFNLQNSFWEYDQSTSATFLTTESATSVKTNRSVEVGILYMDEFDRKSTVLTSISNTIFIPQTLSTSQNRIVANINNNPPAWADRFKLVVKAEPLSYQTIYASIFFEDGIDRWIKLDGESRDKVKEGDYLVVKKDINGPIGTVIKTKVLEVKPQEEDFIPDNKNDQGVDIKEPAGLYMRIKPNGYNVDYAASSFIEDVANGNTESNRPFTRTDQLSQIDEDGNAVDVAIPQGSSIRIRLTSFGRDQGPYIYDRTFITQTNYTNFQEFFEDNIDLPLDTNDPGKQYTNITFVRGKATGNNGVNVTGLATDPLFMLVEGIIAGAGNRAGRLTTEVSIRLVDGFLIFETEPVQADIDIYYETEDTYFIENNYHTGNIQDQSAGNPAIIELDFFNCYVMGNGAESYRIKDAFNKNFLNIDSKPTSTSAQGEEFREVRRFADMTYSEAYVESANVNGLNVFNLSTVNYKELGKEDGSIQKLISRDRDIVVLQEEEASKVLFEKDAVYSAGGGNALVSSPGILGEQIMYRGGQGVSKNPESVAMDEDGRIYYSNLKKGTVLRLSLDGVEKIVTGMRDYFRDMFRERPNAKVLGGVNPYHGHYVISVGDEPVRVPLFQCATQIIKNAITETFSYDIQLNNLGGNISIQYVVGPGNVTIVAEFNGNSYVASNVTGSGAITFNRDSLVQNRVRVTVTPISAEVSYTLANICPTGSPMTIVSIVLNDVDDIKKTIIDRYRWGGSPFYSTDELFTQDPLTRFESITGVEGVGQFPVNGSLVTIQSFKDTISSGSFNVSECNRLGYLVSNTVYNESNINTILGLATFPTITTSGGEAGSQINSANFLFNKVNTNDILYMIYDYTSRNPVINDDSASVQSGGTVIINVLANDSVSSEAIVTIAVQPLYGTAIVNPDMTISYTHDGSENFNDELRYTVTDNGCSSTANVFISIGVSCDGVINASGNLGIYEALINFGTQTGLCGIQLDAVSVPDRFEIIWNDNVVADSKYVGDGLVTNPPPVSYSGLLGEKTLDVFEYNGTSFVDTGVDETITVIQDDIADNITYPTDGTGYIFFNKTTSTPVTAKLRVTGSVGGTAWSINRVICPTPLSDLVTGTNKLVYGFFPLSGREGNTKSMGFFRGTSPDKFYTNALGETNFSTFGWNSSNRFINDGVSWYEIDSTGNIISTGTL